MIFFTSDHHFDHTNIIKYCSRPFQSVDEMNEVMVKRWNEVVGVRDTVYYLGDFSLGKGSIEKFVPRLNGEKYLIMGNHDACHPCNKKKAEMAVKLYEEVGFKMLGLESAIEIGGTEARLHHMPYQSSAPSEGYAKEPKHLKYRPVDDGRWLLHGHIHEKWQSKEKMINVGVDVWGFYPVPIAAIEKIISGAG